MASLLPCPFCGGTAELRDAADGRQNWVECLTPLCHGMGANLATPREAAVAWNRRAAPVSAESNEVTA